MKRQFVLAAAGLVAVGLVAAMGIHAAGIAGSPAIAVSPQGTQPTQPTPPATLPSLDNYLKWDSVAKDVTVSNGSPAGHFSFFFTNASTEAVIITSALGSCGCTVAEMPETPWTNLPGATGEIKVTMNVQGKFGQVFKTVTVGTADHGTKVLMVKTIIAPPAPVAGMEAADRARNQQLAISDRQAIFKNDCARCHVEPTRDKMGHDLYASACGICHEAEHRATMVPDLHAIPQETNGEFWHNWITYGKPGTLMPAFAKSEGGVLTDAQIASLVNYLTATIPPHAAAPRAAAN